jgi:hypothetical protein
MENVRCRFPLRMLTSLFFITLSISQSGVVQAQDSDQSRSSPIGTTPFGILNLISPSTTLEIALTAPEGTVLQSKKPLSKESEQNHAKQQIYKDISKAGFITGGLSAIATGIVYFIGKSTMASYVNATDPTDAENLHSQLSNYNSMFFTYLSVSAVGLALGGILVAITPRPSKIDEQVQGSIGRLQKQEAERTAKGQE